MSNVEGERGSPRLHVAETAAPRAVLSVEDERGTLFAHVKNFAELSASPGEGALQSWMVRLSLLILWAIIALLSWVPGAAGEEAPTAPVPPTDGSSVVDLSLEQLLNVEITSVSKKEEKRSAAPAAVYVLTQEDIRRSSATTVPDLLRTVPGLHVAQQDAGKWSVTARGFTGRFANKLLVLIDGRSIYTPFFSGVYWEANDVMLEDVERIEIIRGPGGTLWGANAVNGVINIITKKASDTQGGLLSVAGGTEHRASSALRYGGKAGDLGYYRAYAKYFYTDQGGSFIENGPGSTGDEANDDWHNGQAGFRMDLDVSADDKLMIQGGIQVIGANATFDLPYYTDPLFVRTDSHAELQHYYLSGQWTHRLADDSEMQLQGYWDHYHSQDVTLDEQRHTIDLDFQHRLPAGRRNDILWGLGFRVTTDDFENSPFILMNPEQGTDLLFSAFIQDEIEILDTLHLTLGTKIEHNDYTGIEVQPSARIAWTPTDKQTLWGAVSRAVRTPSRAESDIRLNYGESSQFPGAFIAAFGSRDLHSEELIAYELGYRIQVADRLALDTAFFYNDYDHVRTVEVGTPFVENDPAPAHTILPAQITTNGQAKMWGFEVGADVNIRPWWLVRASYSFIDVSTNSNTLSRNLIEAVPHNLFSVQTRFDLPRNLELDTTLRYVDSIDTLSIGNYLELDTRLAWRPSKDLEFSIGARNLLDSEHEEYADIITLAVPTQVQRGVYGKITWRF
jgi:iron complex outermembrane receptor protein